MRPRSNKKINDILFYLLGAFPKNTHIDPAVMGVLALTYPDEPVEELINRLLKGEFGKKKGK
jgi:hypothetical protein